MKQLVPFDPFEEMRELQKQFFGDDWGGALQTTSSMQLPTTDVYTEDDKRMIVEAHLPHYDDKDVDISIDKGALVIRAEKHDKKEKNNKKYVVRESSSSFYRRIRLPEHADEDNIDAHMEKGILKVTVPFKELPKPKKISVKSKAKKK
ncbi:MAG: Hsp20/alpha crystallin family protein [Candidatus Saccharibacteria bacterium]|nr:Hsp20/alpha crystallin family protein [Candidatus Saccharibacteria bacterium]